MKKTTATLTWLHNGNYGTMLQAYALQRVITLKGYQNEIIDYSAGKLVKFINLFLSGNSLKLFYYKFRGFMNSRAANKMKNTDTIENTNRGEVFDRFLENKLKTTKVFRTPFALKGLQKKYDVYICGSDQIWNPELMNPPFFFSFLSDSDKKVAYSPSFGVKRIIGKKRNRIQNYLSKFSHISLREEQGLFILKDMGFDIRNIPVVLDPTLLISKEEWVKFSKEVESEKTPYILCYFLHDNPVYWESAETLSKKLGCKIVFIPVDSNSYDQKYEKKINAGPEEWVKLLSDAKFVLTDSYHGILFCLMFNVDFYVYKRYADDDPASQNSRVESILEKVGLLDRLLSKSAPLPEVTNIQNYNEIDRIIDCERKKSLEYLFNAIEQ